jgi:hypothetical protein
MDRLAACLSSFFLLPAYSLSVVSFPSCLLSVPAVRLLFLNAPSLCLSACRPTLLSAFFLAVIFFCLAKTVSHADSSPFHAVVCLFDLPACLLVWIYVCLPAYLSAFLSIYPPACPFACLYNFLPVCQPCLYSILLIECEQTLCRTGRLYISRTKHVETAWIPVPFKKLLG